MIERPRKLAARTRVVLWITLGAQLAAIAHAAMVAHVTCPADGELIHAAAGAPAVSSLTVPAWTAAGADDLSHERCLLDEEGDAAPTAPAMAVRVAPPAAAVAAVRLAPPSAARGRIYRLAPKNSPPA